MYGKSYNRQAVGQPIEARTIKRPIVGVEALERAVFKGKLRKQTGPGGIPLVTDAPGGDIIRTARTPSGGIPAMSGNTVGSAVCTLYVFTPPNQQVLGTETVTVLNDITAAVAGSRKIKIYYSEGAWWFDVMSCT